MDRGQDTEVHRFRLYVLHVEGFHRRLLLEAHQIPYAGNLGHLHMLALMIVN